MVPCAGVIGLTFEQRELTDELLDIFLIIRPKISNKDLVEVTVVRQLFLRMVANGIYLDS